MRPDPTRSDLSVAKISSYPVTLRRLSAFLALAFVSASLPTPALLAASSDLAFATLRREAVSDNPKELAGLEEALGKSPEAGMSRREFIKVGAAGLESAASWDRRTFLKASLAGLVTAFIPEFYGLTPSEAAQPGPVGALVPLREKLGVQRQLGMVIWDPRDLLRLQDFFPLAVRAGVNTVWISGYRFRSMSSRQQQTLLTRASQAGLPVLGFIDGNDDWPEQRVLVANHYRALIERLASLNLGNLRVEFAVDVEPYTRQGWSGDLTGYMDLIEQVILPQIVAFARQSRQVVPGLVRFEPWWYENGRKTDSGATLRGLRAIPRTDIAAMTYRDAAEDIAASSEIARRRAREEGATFQIGVETIPSEAVGTPSFYQKEVEIGPALLGAIQAMPQTDQARLRGAFIHAQSPLTAHRILTALVQAKPARPSEPSSTQLRQPAKEFGVKGGRILSDPRTQPEIMRLEFELTRELAGKDLVAVPVNVADLAYPQPYADGRRTFAVDKVTWQVTVESHPNHPFFGGNIDRRAVILIERSHVKEFFEKYGDGFSRLEVDGPILAIVEVDDKGVTKVVTELRSGLEQAVATVGQVVEGWRRGEDTVVAIAPSVWTALQPEDRIRLRTLLEFAAATGLEQLVEIPEDPAAQRDLVAQISLKDDRTPLTITVLQAGLEDMTAQRFRGYAQILGLPVRPQPVATSDFLTFMAQIQAGLESAPISAIDTEQLKPLVGALDFLA